MKNHRNLVVVTIFISAMVIASLTAASSSQTLYSADSAEANDLPPNRWLAVSGPAYADTPDNSDLVVGTALGQSFTVEAWVYPILSGHYCFNNCYYDSDIVGNADWGFGFETGDTPDPPPGQHHSLYYLCFFRDATGKFCWFPRDDFFVPILAFPNWHHVAAVYETNSELRLYMDGKLGGNSPYAEVLAHQSTPSEVGKGRKLIGQSQFGEFLNGRVSELRISDIARYSGAVYTIPTSRFACDEHTRTLWHFDESAGTTIFHDVCGSTDNTLTGYNGAQIAESPPPTLTINYNSGKPGSFFTFTGTNFPPNSTATIAVNGHTLTNTVTVDSSGNLVFLLDTSQASPGRYFATATVNPSATQHFTLDPNAPLHSQEGSGTIISVPSGIALDKFVYLPLVTKQ